MNSRKVKKEDDECVGAVLVVGGGISGMQSALDLAESGFKVYLLDKTPAIGGTMAQLDKTFPTNDCSMCIMAPKLVEVGRHPNIELLTYSELEEIKGSAGHFKVEVRKKARFVDESRCTGCGVCTTKCLIRNIPQIPDAASIRDSIDAKDLQRYDEIINRYGGEKGALISILQDMNAEFNYLPETALKYTAEELKTPLSQVYHVATFYTAFSLKPRGKHLVKVCVGTACHVRGAQKVLETIQRKLGIKPGETTKDQKFTLETVSCLGACALGPVVVIDNNYHPATVSTINTLFNKYEKSEEEKKEKNHEKT